MSSRVGDMMSPRVGDLLKKVPQRRKREKMAKLLGGKAGRRLLRGTFLPNLGSRSENSVQG
jgi:hypothetical protein